VSSTVRLLLRMGCLLAIPLANAAPEAVTAESTAWVSHTTVVRLVYLPRHYSCPDLEKRIRDLLLALGVRPDMDITASECEGGANGYSPRVRVQFATPSQLLGASTATTGPKPTVRTVRLAPGHLGSWEPRDCELMRQLKDQLLSQLNMKVVAFSLACLAPAVNSEHYSVTVQAADPSSVPTKLAAARAH
jgi:hypothetical protein